MNKILIATGIYPPDIGGPATILKAFINSLITQNFEIKVITYSDEVDEGETEKGEVYRIKRKQNVISRYFKYFWQMQKLARWADVIYVTDVYSVGYFAYLLKKLLGQKYIVRFAGDSAWETAVSKGWTKDYIVDFQTKTYNHQIEKLKARRKEILVKADKVIAVSKFMAEIAKKIGVNEDKIKVIYNSIDFISEESKTGEIEKIKKKFGQDAKIIVTACRLTSWKGVDGIIKMLPGLKEKVGNINFLVLGDGQELDNLKQLALGLDISDQVHFLGRIKHSQIMNYFQAADLFILNTNYEGLSHTLLEAMKAEVPIIATNVGGNPEVIEDGREGLLIKYNNQNDLLTSSLRVLTDQDLARKLSSQAKEELKKFSWDKMIAETVEVLKKVNHG
jgi:glycosyltransferase involved in cell wall biosynthesis